VKGPTGSYTTTYDLTRGSDPAAVIDHLETLDERIQTHLEELEPPPGSHESGDGEEDDSPREPAGPLVRCPESHCQESELLPRLLAFCKRCPLST
jgi:hypothetical protein